MAQDKKQRGRPTEKEQTPDRVYYNTRINLARKLQAGKITQEQHIKLMAEAKLKLLQSNSN